MTTPTPWTILHQTTSDLSGQGRGQHMTLIRTYRHGDTKAQVHVSLDTSYPFQSRINASIWTDAGWSQVVSILGDDPVITSLGAHSGGRDVSKKQADLDKVAAILLERVGQIVL